MTLENYDSLCIGWTARQYGRLDLVSRQGCAGPGRSPHGENVLTTESVAREEGVLPERGSLLYPRETRGESETTYTPLMEIRGEFETN